MLRLGLHSQLSTTTLRSDITDEDEGILGHPEPSEQYNFDKGHRVTSLKGFSGCHVTLIEEEGRNYVRKIAKDLEYNDRLIRQAEKQKDFLDDPFFKTADVFTIGTLDSGLAYFDMEYIPGVSGPEAIASLPLREVARFAEALAQFSGKLVSRYRKIASRYVGTMELPSR